MFCFIFFPFFPFFSPPKKKKSLNSRQAENDQLSRQVPVATHLLIILLNTRFVLIQAHAGLYSGIPFPVPVLEAGPCGPDRPRCPGSNINTAAVWAALSQPWSKGAGIGVWHCSLPAHHQSYISHSHPSDYCCWSLAGLFPVALFKTVFSSTVYAAPGMVVKVWIEWEHLILSLTILLVCWWKEINNVQASPNHMILTNNV